MNNNLKKCSGFISILLAAAMMLPMMPPAFAEVQKYGESNNTEIEESIMPMADATSETSIHISPDFSSSEITTSGALEYEIDGEEVTTPGALGYIFDAENKEITGYTGTATEIVIPSEFKVGGKIVPVESIGREAFENNKEIVKVTIPGTIKIIAAYAFSKCVNLSEVTLNDGLQLIKTQSFDYTAIKEVNIPGSVETIGTNAFDSCAYLSEVTLNEGLKKIDSSAFSNTAIEEIEIPSTIKNISKQIFHYTPIKRIIILNSKENISIHQKAFPEGVEVIYKDKGDPGDEDVKTPEELGYKFDKENKEITEYTGTETEIIIPSEFKVEEETMPVENIGKGAFENNKEIVKVTIPGTIKTIGEGAFSQCESLSEVILNEGLEEIGESSFESARSIEEINIPGSVKSVGKEAFRMCSSLKTITLNDGLEEIGSGAFNSSALKEVNIPGSVKIIEAYTFNQCRDLGKVTLNEGLEEIGESSFESDRSIEEINIPGSVKSVGKEAFRDCSSLKAITLNDGLEEIGPNAFYNIAVEEINIPGSVPTIGNSAFNSCKNLSNVTLNYGLQIISTSAFRNTAIKEINIPGSVETIGNDAFTECTDLSVVTLNEGLKEIKKGAFGNTAIKELEIPSTIEIIGSKIFAGFYGGEENIRKVIIWNKKENIEIARDAFPETAEVVFYEKEEDEKNIITDYILKKIINKNLGKDELSDVTKNDLAGIKSIKSLESGLDSKELWKLKSLEGLQYAANLADLELSGVQVTDLEPLKELSNLESLSIDGSYTGDNTQLQGKKAELKDITPVEEMNQLKYLHICGTQLENIAPVEKLTNLQILHFSNNEISDISCLKNVPVSSHLLLNSNCIGDFTPVKDKKSFRADESEIGQRVSIFPEDTEFDNPLISSAGEYVILPENEYAVNTGDNNEKLKILKMPSDESKITIEYGSTTSPSSLTVNLTNLNTIKDPVLVKAVNMYINEKNKEERRTDQSVVKSDLTGLTELTLAYITEDERKEIKDITGLENLISATKLDLKGSSVEDLRPIGKLEKLENIFLGGSYDDDGSPNVYLKYDNTKWRSPLKDISPLAGLTNLKSVYINDSQVVDVSPLRDLENLNSVYLMRNKIENIECLKDVPVAIQLYLQGNCIGDFSTLKDKSVLKLYHGQTVTVVPDEEEFQNPLKDVSGDYVMLPENEYLANTGDKGENIKILKMPVDGNIISVQYGNTEGSGTLSVDVSNIRDDTEAPSNKNQVYFYILKKQEGSEVTVDDAYVQVYNDKGEELTNENTVLYAWNLADGKYSYKVSRDGYEDAEGVFEVEGKGTTVQVKLIPVSEEEPGDTEEPDDSGRHNGSDRPGRPSNNSGGSSDKPSDLTPSEETPKKPEGTEISAGSGAKITLDKSFIEISEGTFDKNVVVIAEENGLYLELNGVDDEGNTAEIKKPLFVTMHYDKEVRNADNITVIITDENGNEEMIGGVYDNNTKTVKFLTNKWGKFSVRESINEFSDLSGVEWARPAIRSLSVKGIMKGKSEDIFAPSDDITRAEFTAVISRILKLNENIVQDVPFEDVAVDKWYYKPIAAAYDSGLIKGRSAESFDPEGNITRQEMAVIIGNILNGNSGSSEDVLDKFNDRHSIAEWAERSVTEAVGSGIIIGIDDSFMPNKNTTRAEAAVMLYRLYPLVINPEY